MAHASTSINLGKILPGENSKIWKGLHYLGTGGHTLDSQACVTIINQAIGATINALGTTAAVIRARQVKVARDHYIAVKSALTPGDQATYPRFDAPSPSTLYNVLIGAQTVFSFLTDNITSTKTYIQRVMLTSVDASTEGALEGLGPEARAEAENSAAETVVPIDLSNHPLERALNWLGTYGHTREDAAAIANNEDQNTILAGVLGAYADSLMAKKHVSTTDSVIWGVTVGARTWLRSWLRNRLSNAATIELVTRGALRRNVAAATAAAAAAETQ